MAAKALIARLRGPLSARPGKTGEDLACEYLGTRGYEIVARNFRCRSGEVDIIARLGATTVFVEVKERRGASHGEGHEAVTFGKRLRIVRASRLYAAAHGLFESPLRFDVVSIDWAHGEPRFRHEAGAFDADGR